jgi:hypothetical protein
VSAEQVSRSLLAQGIKVKVKFSLCFIFNRARHDEGVLGEWRYSLTHSLTSALDGGEWPASRPDRFTLREWAPHTHWIWGWVSRRASLDAAVERKILSTCWDSCSPIPLSYHVDLLRSNAASDSGRVKGGEVGTCDYFRTLYRCLKLCRVDSYVVWWV